MMLGIHSVLKAHHSAISTKFSLKEAFGDGYLMRHNHLYRNIRLAVDECGFRFSSKKVEWYHSSPVGSLDTMVQRKIIPFVANGASFLKVGTQIEGHYPASLILPPTLNFLIHESCHCIARSLHSKFFGKVRKASAEIQERKLQVLHHLIGEAYGLACENFGSYFVSSDVHCRIYNWNSSRKCSGSRARSMKKLAKAIGRKDALKLLTLVFLRLVYGKQVDISSLKELMIQLKGAKGCSSSQFKTAFAVVREIKLPRETDLITQFYFVQAGFGSVSDELRETDAISEVQADMRLDQWIDILSEIATRPSPDARTVFLAA